MKILLVEDNEILSRFIKKALEEEGYAVDHTADGKEGYNMGLVNDSAYDVIILDILLPSLNGYEVCKKLRQEEINTPVLMLSAKDSTESKVEGLDSGADDYLAKPFEMPELLARIKALLRRKENVVEEKIKVKDLELDLNSHEVLKDGEPLTLTNIEFRLLSLLMERRGKVLKRSEIIEKVWDMYSGDHFSNTVDVHVRQLRKKLGENKNNTYIITVRGVGYKFVEE